MNIATRLKQYLDSTGISYECIHHPRTATTLAAARKANVPADDVAKCVLLGDDQGYLLALLPASHRLDLDEIERLEVSGALRAGRRVAAALVVDWCRYRFRQPACLEFLPPHLAL